MAATPVVVLLFLPYVHVNIYSPHNYLLFVLLGLVQLTGVRSHSANTSADTKPLSPRIEEFRKKLREKTPLGKLDELDRHPYQEKEPLAPFPDNINPDTGNILK